MGRADRVQRPGEQRGGKGGRERRAASSHVTFQQAVAQTPEISFEVALFCRPEGAETKTTTRNTARNAKITGQKARILSCVSGH